MKKTLLLAFSFLCFSAMAANTAFKPMTSIAGNPINRQDDFTLNSNKAVSTTVRCVFTNTGDQPVKLEVWTAPDATVPAQKLELKKGTKLAPTQLKDTFALQLKKHWWCRIYTPKSQKSLWHFCSYFSISDATITEYKPFGNFDKTIHSKDASYHCVIEKPQANFSFFYFK